MNNWRGSEFVYDVDSSYELIQNTYKNMFEVMRRLSGDIANDTVREGMNTFLTEEERRFHSCFTCWGKILTASNEVNAILATDNDDVFPFI